MNKYMPTLQFLRNTILPSWIFPNINAFVMIVKNKKGSKYIAAFIHINTNRRKSVNVRFLQFNSLVAKSLLFNSITNIPDDVQPYR